MTKTQYEQVARLISLVRNSRYGQMVRYLEELITTGIWQDFTTPDGTHFEFRRCEFDYFLAAMEIDPEMVKHSYIHARDVDGLAAKRILLADITGRGVAPANGDRRDRKAVAEAYGERVLRYGAVVSRETAQVAQNPQRRKAVSSGHAKWTRPDRKRWITEWTDDRTSAEAIAGKLLADPELAHEVWKILRNELYNAKTGKRRSEAQNGSKGASLTTSANRGDGTR